MGRRLTLKGHSLRAVGAAYLDAKRAVIESGYAAEIDWQYDCLTREVSETDFLRESAWVVLSTGMREQVVRKHFPAVSVAFHSWRSAMDIAADADRCFTAGFGAFGHAGKIRAICRIAMTVAEVGFEEVLQGIRELGASYLTRFPYIGPVTSVHLAKNLGENVAKPDRHLVRLAAAVGVGTPAELCESISAGTSEHVAVIDVVLWRYANLNRNYCAQFRQLISWEEQQS